jgi:hypothetical protein
MIEREPWKSTLYDALLQYDHKVEYDDKEIEGCNRQELRPTTFGWTSEGRRRPRKHTQESAENASQRGLHILLSSMVESMIVSTELFQALSGQRIRQYASNAMTRSRVEPIRFPIHSLIAEMYLAPQR